MSNKPSGNMETVYQTEAQWTADTRVFGADVVAVTVGGANDGKHKLFKGTGRWTTLSYVEDSTGSGVTSVNGDTGPAVVLGAEDIDIIDFLLVYGAGTPGANGVYPYVGQSNSKPSYQKGSGNGSHLVTWGAVSSQWTIGLVDLSPVYYYNSTDDVATPDLATFTVTAGAGPVPTVVRFTGTVQQALQALAALQGSIAQDWRYRGKRTFSGTTDTLLIGDGGGLVLATNVGAITITVPPQSDVAFPERVTITSFPNSDTGQITFAPGSGVTLLSGGGALKTAMPYGGVTLTLIDASTNTWWVEGNLTV